MASLVVNISASQEKTPQTGESLAFLLALVRDAGDAAELKRRLFPAATRFFGATRGGLFLLAEAPKDVRWQENPVARALRERHAPLHEEQLMSERQWQSLALREDHGHVLAGPIVQEGELIGVLAFTRLVGEAPFGESDLADLSALCLHVSTQLAQPHLQANFALTPRQAQIVALVAQGQTNAQIGRALFVSSETVKACLKGLFRKTGAKSRAELVAVLAQGRPR